MQDRFRAVQDDKKFSDGINKFIAQLFGCFWNTIYKIVMKQ